MGSTGLHRARATNVSRQQATSFDETEDPLIENTPTGTKCVCVGEWGSGGRGTFGGFYKQFCDEIWRSDRTEVMKESRFAASRVFERPFAIM